MSQYTILLHQITLQKAESYRKALVSREIQAGTYLKNALTGINPAQIDTSDLIGYLLKTKHPQIFAESAVAGDGSDWSPIELSILGDISIVVPVQVFDDGRHTSPAIHTRPFDATLLYVPGALLQNGRGKIPADWNDVTVGNELQPEAYYTLYERRLLPGFLYADQAAGAKGKQALFTIPGLGCGQFAGKFHGQLGVELRNTLIMFLENYSAQLLHTRAVYYDPYRECQNERYDIGHISLLVRPLTLGNTGKSQLCPPQVYEEGNDDFSNCELFSFVAWDHVSWPGNDFYLGARATDDGVKAAATSSMAMITGVAGRYNPRTNTYDPPRKYRNWDDLVSQENIQLAAGDNIIVLP